MGYFGVTPIEITFNVFVHILGILAVALMIKLLATKHGPSIQSWRLLFYALLVFVAKKIVVGLKDTGIIFVPSTLFNVIIISIFIYAVLVETELLNSNPSVKDIKNLNKSLQKINKKL